MGPFPTSVESVLSYFEVRENEGVAQNFYNDFKAALKFMELAGERPVSECLHRHPAIENSYKEGQIRLAKGKKGSSRMGRQSPPLLVCIVVQVENIVVGEAPNFIRLYAWFRLVRHWAALRFDDTMEIRPSQIEKRSRGLAGALERTKTSGPGKQQQ